jgi:hypothetical protein
MKFNIKGTKIKALFAQCDYKLIIMSNNTLFLDSIKIEAAKFSEMLVKWRHSKHEGNIHQQSCENP